MDIQMKEVIQHQGQMLPIGCGYDKGKFVVKVGLMAGQKFLLESHIYPRSAGICGVLLEIQKGTGLIQVEDVISEYGPGSKFFIGSGIVHGFVEVHEATVFTKTLQNVQAISA